MTKAAPVLALAALVFCLGGARPAAAGFVSTNDLERSCMSDKKEQVVGCLNYIAGVVDYHILMQSFGTQPTIDFCLPDNITVQDAGVAVVKYLKSHPEHDAIASAVVPMALNDAYPCHPHPKPKVLKSTKSSKHRRH